MTASDSTECEETTCNMKMTDEKESCLYSTIRKRIDGLASVKFAAYRVACKLRILQKHLKLTYVDYNILVRAFNSRQLQFGVETTTIGYDSARQTILGIYQLISSYHFTEASMDEVIDTLLKFLADILHLEKDENFDLNAFKIILFALSNAKLPEKYRCFFRQITSPNVIASQVKLTELLEILLKIPNHFDQVDSFNFENIPACVQSCLDHTHDGIIREDIFVNWMSREPQTLVWLPTLHRLIVTETVRHEARCNNCRTYPVIGMRYRCLRCFNYDLCQTCFFTGEHGKKHDSTHPIEEYCKQVTPFEDLRAFVEFLKLKMGKRELRRKERYLSIERSKSFTDTPVHSSVNSSSHLMTNGHQSLKRTQISPNKANVQDIYRAVPTSDPHDSVGSNESPISPRQNEEKIPLTGYDNVPVEQTKKKSSKEKRVFDTDSTFSSSKTKNSIQRNNYVNISQNKAASQMSDEEEAPMLLPKLHTSNKKSLNISQQTEILIHTEHYQLPPNEMAIEKDEYQPPLPPKQRQQQNVSRALVYDFIGSELQELRATLAQFNGNSSI